MYNPEETSNTDCPLDRLLAEKSTARRKEKKKIRKGEKK